MQILQLQIFGVACVKCVHMCRCVIISIPSMIGHGCAIIEAMCSLMEPIDV